MECRGDLVPLSACLRRTLVAQAGGDALDSLIAAWIAFQALLHPPPPAPPDWEPVEGYVFG